jgi:hypothetical protein
VGLGWFVNAYSSLSIHNVKEVGLPSTKGSFPGCKGVWLAGCKVMVLQANLVGLEVTVWLCLPILLGLLCSLGLVPKYVVLVLGNEGGCPYHKQGCHTRGLWIGLRKLVVLTLNIHQIIN